MTDLSRMRISDVDRNGVIDRLQRATAEGRLDLDELDDRIAGALAARTWSDLDPLVDDLPVVEAAPAESAPEEPAPPGGIGGWSLATLAAGAVSITASFWSPWGALVGLITAALGAVLLLGPRELSQGDRLAILIGTVLGLVPSAFFVILIVFLAG